MPASEFDWGFKAQGAREAGILLGILEKLDSVLGVLSRREQQTAQAFNTFKTIIDRSSHTVNKYSNSISQSTQIHQKYDNRVNNSVTVINKFGKQTAQTSGRVRTLFQQLTKAAGIWNTWNKAVDFAMKRLRQFTRLMTGWEKSLRTIGGAFERSEATLRVLAQSAGSTAEEIELLVGSTKRLGRETEFTAGQAAAGAITLLKAGNSASEATLKLEAALEAAMATGLDFAKAAKVGNYAWNIFGKNLGKTGGLTHDYATALKIMIASANSADTTVTQLSAALTGGGNILSDLGVSLTRTTTALGLLAQRGVLGRKSMRLLSIGVKRLVDGTRPAQKALAELGITAVDQQGQMKDLGVLMGELGNALDLRRPNEQMRLMKALFGAGDKVMRALLDAGLSGFNELENSIQKALGTMGQLQEARTDTIVGAWKKFRSAVEGVWVELVAVLRVPVMEYWNTLASILRKVSVHIETVGRRFKENAGSLKDWIKLIQSGGIKGLFQGLPEELEPEIAKLEDLWKAFTQTVGSLLREIWDTFMDSAVFVRIKEFGKSIGQSILEGIKTGIGEETFEKLLGAASTVASVVSAPVKAVKYVAGTREGDYYDFLGKEKQKRELQRERTTKITQAFTSAGRVFSLAEDAKAKKSVEAEEAASAITYGEYSGERSWEAAETVAKINEKAQKAAMSGYQKTTPGSTAEEIQKQVDGGMYARNVQSAEIGEGKKQTESRAKKRVDAQQKIDEGQYAGSWLGGVALAGSGEVSRVISEEEILRKNLSQLSSDELKAKQEVLNAQQQLNNEETKYEEALERSKNILHETNVVINEIGSNFEQWLVNPVDVFQQKLMGVKQTFGDLIAGFQQKKVDLAEKFGLKTSEESAIARKKLGEKGLKRDEELLKFVQTPEEEMKIRERMAEKAVGMAEMTEGAEKQRYIKKAEKFLTDTEEAAKKAQTIEIERLEIQQDFAKKNLAEYESMIHGAETSGEKAAKLELAQQAYMTLGPEYAAKAAKVTEELKVSKAEAATEEAENWKLIAENSTTEVDLLNRMVEIAQEQLSAFRTRSQIPQNAEFADDTGM